MSFLLKNCLKFSFGKQFLQSCASQNQQNLLKNLKTTSDVLFPHKEKRDVTEHKDSYASTTKRQKEVTKITLIQNQTMTVTSLDDAKNMARRRSLHLVKVQDMDTKSQRPVYKLLSPAEMLDDELSDLRKLDKSTTAGDKASSKKSEKSLSISSRIAEHDLTSRLKNILKWLNKQHEVRVLIQASSEQDLVNCEKIFKTMEDFVKNPQVIGKIVQKRTKGNAIKFTILPATSTVSHKPTSNTQ